MELPTAEQLDDLRTQGDQAYELLGVAAEMRTEILELRKQRKEMKEDLQQAHETIMELKDSVAWFEQNY